MGRSSARYLPIPRPAGGVTPRAPGPAWGGRTPAVRVRVVSGRPAVVWGAALSRSERACVGAFGGPGTRPASSAVSGSYRRTLFPTCDIPALLWDKSPCGAALGGQCPGLGTRGDMRTQRGELLPATPSAPRFPTEGILGAERVCIVKPQ